MAEVDVPFMVCLRVIHLLAPLNALAGNLKDHNDLYSDAYA
jgi:hypothetical protein